MNRKQVCRRNMVDTWKLEAWERIAQVVNDRDPALTVDEASKSSAPPSKSPTPETDCPPR